MISLILLKLLTFSQILQVVHILFLATVHTLSLYFYDEEIVTLLWLSLQDFDKIVYLKAVRQLLQHWDVFCCNM